MKSTMIFHPQKPFNHKVLSFQVCGKLTYTAHLNAFLAFQQHFSFHNTLHAFHNARIVFREKQFPVLPTIPMLSLKIISFFYYANVPVTINHFHNITFNLTEWVFLERHFHAEAPRKSNDIDGIKKFWVTKKKYL